MKKVERLTRVAKVISRCERCLLHKTRTNTVPGAGSSTASVMFVGEAPGKDEDACGEPFVGRSGKRLAELLDGISLSREDVFIANTVRCRPPGNRDPWPREVRACKRYLKKQIEIINPKVIVPLGKFALGHFMKGFISELHGTMHEIDGRKVVPMYHPAAGFYNNSIRDAQEQDFDFLLQLIQMTSTVVPKRRSSKKMKFDTVIIDGRHLLYRNADSQWDLKSGGVRTGGVYGFLVSLLRIRRHYGEHIIVAWEGRDNFRYALYPEYKRPRREPTEEAQELRESVQDQENRLRQILSALGILQYRGRKCEADDVIGTVSRIVAGSGKRVAIYSGDSDLRQLVTDDITVIAPAFGRSVREDLFTPDRVMARYGFAAHLIADLKALAGDTSDNIPGVSGVGDKTATALIKAYGGTDNILVAASRFAGRNAKNGWPVPERFVAKLLESEREIKLFKSLTTVDQHVKLLARSPKPNADLVRRLFKKYRFDSLLRPSTISLLMSLGGRP